MQVLTGLRWNNPAGVIEAYQVKGWRTHPAVLMWKGFERALADYQDAVCGEWVARGFNDTCAMKTSSLLRASGLPDRLELPGWLGDPAIHRSHRSNLVRKDPDRYGPLFADASAEEAYVWPVNAGGASTTSRSP
jgi:hypothetical protein